MAGFKLRLIENWRNFWKFWSIRLIALASILFGYITVVPEALINAWSILPMELKALLPVNYTMWIGWGILILSAVARVIKQDNVPK